ncbi:hypothetical protein [Acinetobacter sp.]|uniref:hypothetical protein n=1 Tax=Acinetobacter sp. TaxID=472 RepID=UPI003CFD10CE
MKKLIAIRVYFQNHITYTIAWLEVVTDVCKSVGFLLSRTLDNKFYKKLQAFMEFWVENSKMIEKIAMLTTDVIREAFQARTHLIDMAKEIRGTLFEKPELIKLSLAIEALIAHIEKSDDLLPTLAERLIEINTDVMDRVEAAIQNDDRLKAEFEALGSHARELLEGFCDNVDTMVDSLEKPKEEPADA